MRQAITLAAILAMVTGCATTRPNVGTGLPEAPAQEATETNPVDNFHDNLKAIYRNADMKPIDVTEEGTPFAPSPLDEGPTRYFGQAATYDTEQGRVFVYLPHEGGESYVIQYGNVHVDHPVVALGDEMWVIDEQTDQVLKVDFVNDLRCEHGDAIDEYMDMCRMGSEYIPTDLAEAVAEVASQLR